MAKVRVGIIGQGRSGRDIHGAHLITDKRYRIVAVTDPMKDRRERAEKEYGCDAYRDHRDLLKRDDLDVIVNASPSHLHVPYTLEILKAGHNCVCEKPFADNVKDVNKMIAAAKKHKRLLTVFQQSRFAPYFEQVKKVIDSGVLGRIVEITVAFNGFARRYDWQTLTEQMGGNLLNTGPHPMDQALQLLGTDVTPEVFCHMDRVNATGNAEDFVSIALRVPERPLVRVEISSCSAYPTPIYRVNGSCGSLESTMTEAKWRYFDPEVNKPKPRLHRKPLQKADGTPCYCTEKLKWRHGKWTVPKSQNRLFALLSKRFYTMLHDALAKGAPLVITPEQIRQQIAVVQACQKQNPQIYG